MYGHHVLHSTTSKRSAIDPCAIGTRWHLAQPSGMPVPEQASVSSPHTRGPEETASRPVLNAGRRAWSQTLTTRKQMKRADEREDNHRRHRVCGHESGARCVRRPQPRGKARNCASRYTQHLEGAKCLYVRGRVYQHADMACGGKAMPARAPRKVRLELVLVRNQIRETHPPGKGFFCGALMLVQNS